jgi:protein arginine N-methyltransferase 1
MYSIEEYGRMIADKVRTGAYAKALRAAVKPGSIVLDLGAGTGIFSLLACKYGARKVYAVETSEAIEIGRRIAKSNGFSERIEFIQGTSTGITLAEKADVIVSDMHGALPLFHTNIVSIVDARRRMLADGGVLIPQQESLWAAVVEAPDEYAQLVSPWAKENFDLDMDAARHAVTNWVKRAGVKRDQLLAEPQCWGVLDYATIEQPSHAAAISFGATRAGIAHGLILWFDSVLADGIGFSNAPGEPELVYSSSFLPWSAPVPLEVGDTIAARLRADLTGTDYTWGWDSKVFHGNTPGIKVDFRQSTFLGLPFSSTRLRRRGSNYRPMLGEEGQVADLVIGQMNGETPLEDIARTAMRQFPAHFRTFSEALSRVGDLSETYGRDAGDGDITP